jgi:hypothetical protein
MKTEYADHVKKMSFAEFKEHMKNLPILPTLSLEDAETKLAEMYFEATGNDAKKQQRQVQRNIGKSDNKVEE